MSFIGKLNSRGGGIPNPFKKVPSLNKELSTALGTSGKGNARKLEIKKAVQRLLEIKKVTNFETKIDPMLDPSKPQSAEQEILTLTKSKQDTDIFRQEIKELKRIHENNVATIKRLQNISEKHKEKKPTHYQQPLPYPPHPPYPPQINRFGRPIGGYKKPRKKSASSTKKKPSKKNLSKKSPKLHKGPRGGIYIIRKGKKIYQ